MIPYYNIHGLLSISDKEKHYNMSLFDSSSESCVVLHQYAQILPFGQDDTLRNVVFLTEGKDLYEMCTNIILNSSPYSGLMISSSL